MNISIRDEVYRELKRRRAEGESFSDVLERLLRPVKLSDFAGAWADMDADERRELEAHRKRRRELDAQRAKRIRTRLEG